MSYVFAEQAAAAGADLFIVFHGTGGNEHQFTGLARELLPDAHIIAPRGDVSEVGAPRYFRRTGEGVYDMADLATRTAAMTEFVRAHVLRLNPRRVIGLGYSNGANILASVQMLDGTLFDRTVLLHPLIPFEPASQPALKGKHVLITAGELDPICPPQLTKRLHAWYEQQGAAVEMLWHSGGHDVRQPEILAASRFVQLA